MAILIVSLLVSVSSPDVEAGARTSARLIAAVTVHHAHATSLTLHPGNSRILYVGTNEGVFKSTDGARSWRGVFQHFGEPDRFGVSGVAIDPNHPSTVYAVTHHLGLYKTTDGGRTWRPSGPQVVQRGYPAVLAVDPGRTEIVYTGRRDGLRKTSDGGRTWHRVGASLPATPVSALAIDPSDPQTLWAAMNDGRRLFVSRDGGRTWRERTKRLPGLNVYVPSLAFDPREPGAVYAGTAAGIWKSLDHGLSWRTLNTDLMLGDMRVEAPLVFSPTKRGTIYAQTYCKGIFRSTDGGRSWSDANQGLKPGCRPPYKLAIDQRHPQTIYALVPDYGLYKSADGARHWQPTTQPPASP